MRPMRHIIQFSLLIFFLFLVSCSQENREVNHALRLAGDNRAELEKVIDHYSGNKSDSLKLRAAKFLIRYMPLHRSYGKEMEKLYDRLDSIIPYTKRDSLTTAFCNLYNEFKPKLSIHLDIEIITADYLIRNIDQAFDLWQTKPWARYLDFDEFCECLLPYKCMDLQPISDWRLKLASFCSGQLGRYNSEIWRDNPRVAAVEVNRALNARKHSYTTEPNPCPVFRATTLTDLPKGTCNETCLAAALVMRSKGIPAYIDFTPNWPTRPKNHFWLSVINQRHINETLSSFSSTMGDNYFIDRPLSKVFRITYKPNEELYAIIKRDGWLPPSLSNIFVKDVTAAYTKSDTFDCEIYDLYGKGGTIYLAVFDNQEWIPVYWGKRHHYHRVRFEHIGRNVFYMPIIYDEQHAMHPAGDPFFLGPDGKRQYMHPDTTQLRTIRMKRKYGIYEEINKISTSLKGGIIVASNDPHFRDALTVSELPKDSLVLAGTDSISVPDSFRYWQIRSSNASWCDIAELQFYNGETKIQASTFSDTKNEKYINRIDRINDDDALTYSPLQDPDIRIGFDFGRPINVSKIVWFRRSDGNDIYPEYEYTLYYWNDRAWMPVEHQKAGRQSWIDFHNVPDNALLLLVCDTKGTQNRPFTYQKGQVKWY